ncbi:hypothetical protein AKJ09_06877 [Labilithrix luteola]|uniref:HTH luxR-type domain-containing protein n=1 Tax=Labilithrix luteola TaxID=1391654 RepID=A0A0K1Q379_9BACT|nr:helix-turn-helix transcriptional regulator [Labilithrix luteola]AKV00214.1 hypothetical protein AKJ09_06877 [Labilithrix luteola]
MPSPSSILTRTALATVEAAYSLEGDDAAWLERLLRVARLDLDRGFGLYAATGRIERGHLFPRPPFVSVDLDPACRRHALALHGTMPCPILDAFAPRAVVCGALDEAWPRKLSGAQLYRDGMTGARVVDAFLLFAQDGEGGAVKIVAPSTTAIVTHPRTRALWGRVAMHAASALRLRHRVAANESACAVVDPDGRLHEASGELARDRSLRVRLSRAVKDAEHARTALKQDPERALSIWSALLAGRYSVVDRWESDGRRYLAVYKNDPRIPDPRALGATERAVVELVALGASTKEAAYALGLSTDAAAKALEQARRKLGVKSRGELTPFVAGDRASLSVRVGTAHLDVLVANTKMNPEALARLTEAEREVASAVSRGLDNAAIALARGTSVRTIANQLRRIFEKLGVKSRGELGARLFRWSREA